jgi:putative transposase
MDWPRIFASITGTVDQELLLRNEYLAAEHRILKDQVKRRLLLSDPQKQTLAEIGYRLGRTALVDVAHAAKPETSLGWYRTRVVQKVDGSQVRRHVGRPHIRHEVEPLIVRRAKEHRDWGYDRIAGAWATLGHTVSDQTIGTMLRRHDIPPASQRTRTTTWASCIRPHMAVLAGTDCFSVPVLTLRGVVTYDVLFCLHLERRTVEIAGITVHPHERGMQQIARTVTMEEWGVLHHCRDLIHDRDPTYTQSFRAIIESGQVQTIRRPAHSPHLNAYAERWVRSVKEDCVSKLMLFGEGSLRRALQHDRAHDHAERHHQGKGTVLRCPQMTQSPREEPGPCRERHGGLLRDSHRQAA